MKSIKIAFSALLAVLSLILSAQPADRRFLDVPLFFKDALGTPVKKTLDYDEIQGSPYLDSTFTDGVLYFKDTTAMKLLLRYNIFTDRIECRLNGVIYEIGNMQSLNKISIGKALFVYLPFVDGGGYFELLEGGKCFLFQQRIVQFKPEEGPKPIEGTVKPARFVAEPDLFFIAVENSQPVQITGMKSVISALTDQKAKIESYMKAEGLKTTKKENLIKVAKYYNSL